MWSHLGGMKLPRLYAHRLGREYGPDSSAAALARSLEGPIDGLETDVVLTADGDLALLHDPLLSLGTTLGGWAHERSAEEIRSARLLDRFGRETGERPLLLDELLEAVPRELILQLEIKAHADSELAEGTARTLAARLAEAGNRKVEVLSFHAEACATVAALELPARLVLWADYEPEALAVWAAERGLIGFTVEHFLLTERLTAAMRGAGLSVNTGTIDDLELLRRVLVHEPDAITADDPHALQAEVVGRVSEATLAPQQA